jgi:hypothetical protein
LAEGAYLPANTAATTSVFISSDAALTGHGWHRLTSKAAATHGSYSSLSKVGSSGATAILRNSCYTAQVVGTALAPGV